MESSTLNPNRSPCCLNYLLMGRECSSKEQSADNARVRDSMIVPLQKWHFSSMADLPANEAEYER